MKGTVKFFNTSKGFGFIKNDEDSNEYFVHVSGTNEEIKENDKVTFELEDSDRGKRAINVSVDNEQYKLKYDSIQLQFILKVRIGKVRRQIIKKRTQKK